MLSDRVDAHVFYALSGGTLYRSTDRGATFTQRATGLASGKIEAVYGHAGHLWLASSSGLFRSTDGGASFARLTSVAGASVVGFGRAAPGRTHPAAFMVGRVGSVTGVFRSDDTGATWVRVNDDLHQFGALGGAISGDPDVYGRVYVGTNGRGVQYGQPS